jgi:hypothetical protein
MSGPAINYTAPKTVGAFMASDEFMRMLVGPVGSGKSSGSCIEIVRRAMETPPSRDGVRRSRWAVVRNTYPELRDTTMKTWDEWVPEPYFGKWRVSEHTFDVLFETEDGVRVEAEVMFRALDRPQDVKKLLSLELTGCYFNEWKEIPQPVTELMKTRVGRYPRREEVKSPSNPAGKYWHGIFGDTNPPDTDHYLYTQFEELRPEGYAIFKQPGGRSKEAENVEHLQEGYYEKLCQGASKDFIRVYVDGEYGYVREGKPIWPEFQDSLHVAKEPIPLLPGCKKLIIGNDYGLTPAAVWVQQDPADGQYQVIKELISEHMGAMRFGSEQLRICKTEFKSVIEFEGWGDPAGLAGSSVDERETPINVVAAQGVPMSAAPTNDFTLRRDAVGHLLTTLTHLGRPALVICPTLVTLRKGMNGGYCFRRIQVAGDARYEDKPLKNRFSHVCEALQYALVGAGEDRAPLEGGQPKNVRVNVRVHKAVGGTVPPLRQGMDDDELPRRFTVRRSVRN